MIKNNLKPLMRRILEISYKNKLSHIGSCLTALPIIDEIYSLKKKDEKFVLSSGHAGLALYVVLEKYEGYNAEKLFEQSGVHPDRVATRRFIEGTVNGYEEPIHCSTGSLGQGLPIAVGMALSDRSKNVYCLISDGEMAEGSIYEALNIIFRENIKNLKLYINWNGWTAYGKASYPVLNFDSLPMPDANFRRTNSSQLPFLKGIDAHYYIMKEEDYKQALALLS